MIILISATPDRKTLNFQLRPGNTHSSLLTSLSKEATFNFPERRIQKGKNRIRSLYPPQVTRIHWRSGLKYLILGLASAGYVGYFPRAPGTVGTIVGVLIFLIYSLFPPLIYLLSTAAFFALACWASERAEVILGQKDSPKIVIDEVVGYLITMAFLPCTLNSLAAGFLFFRLFDIIKPPPVGTINRRMQGGVGIVLDDVVAGIYANILLRLVIHWHPDILFLTGSP